MANEKYVVTPDITQPIPVSEPTPEPEQPLPTIAPVEPSEAFIEAQEAGLIPEGAVYAPAVEPISEETLQKIRETTEAGFTPTWMYGKAQEVKEGAPEGYYTAEQAQQIAKMEEERKGGLREHIVALREYSIEKAAAELQIQELRIEHQSALESLESFRVDGGYDLIAAIASGRMGDVRKAEELGLFSSMDIFEAQKSAIDLKSIVRSLGELGPFITKEGELKVSEAISGGISPTTMRLAGFDITNKEYQTALTYSMILPYLSEEGTISPYGLSLAMGKADLTPEQLVQVGLSGEMIAEAQKYVGERPPYEVFLREYERTNPLTAEQVRGYGYLGNERWIAQVLKSTEEKRGGIPQYDLAVKWHREAQKAYNKIYGEYAYGQAKGIQAAQLLVAPARVLEPTVTFKDIGGLEWAVGTGQVALLTIPIWGPLAGRVASPVLRRVPFIKGFMPVKPMPVTQLERLMGEAPMRFGEYRSLWAAKPTFSTTDISRMIYTKPMSATTFGRITTLAELEGMWGKGGLMWTAAPGVETAPILVPSPALPVPGIALPTPGIKFPPMVFPSPFSFPTTIFPITPAKVTVFPTVLPDIVSVRAPKGVPGPGVVSFPEITGFPGFEPIISPFPEFAPEPIPGFEPAPVTKTEFAPELVIVGVEEPVPGPEPIPEPLPEPLTEYIPPPSPVVITTAITEAPPGEDLFPGFPFFLPGWAKLGVGFPKRTRFKGTVYGGIPWTVPEMVVEIRDPLTGVTHKKRVIKGKKVPFGGRRIKALREPKTKILKRIRV